MRMMTPHDYLKIVRKALLEINELLISDDKAKFNRGIFNLGVLLENIDSHVESLKDATDDQHNVQDDDQDDDIHDALDNVVKCALILRNRLDKD